MDIFCGHTDDSARYIAGLFGFVALSKDSFYLVTERQLAVFDFTAWGWAHIILAVILLTGGFSLFKGGLWGRIIASIAASLSLIANLIFLPAYPIWSIAAITIDVLVLYAIFVHGSEARIENEATKDLGKFKQNNSPYRTRT